MIKSVVVDLFVFAQQLLLYYVGSWLVVELVQYLQDVVELSCSGYRVYSPVCAVARLAWQTCNTTLQNIKHRNRQSSNTISPSSSSQHSSILLANKPHFNLRIGEIPSTRP